jgi:hypothetical protein
MKKAIFCAMFGVVFVTATEIDVFARGGGGFSSGGRSSIIGSGTGSSHSSHNVRGYVRRDGTYVAPHYQSNPDRSFNNNWSTKPNINPFTGQEGKRLAPIDNGNN